MGLGAGDKIGAYEILGPLGAGGMGEVFRARDARLGRDVAVKVLPEVLREDAGRLRRFEQEARATGALNHPNVLAVHDVGEHDGAPYLVTELLEGQTLRERLADGPVPWRKALEWGRQIAAGLAAAHDKGIVHRDLKPENLFVTKDGRVKILDFGLAKEIGGDASPAESTLTSTEPGAVLGTAGYMAPEQVRGRPADTRSDIFAFGAVLYELLSGKRAFDGETPVERGYAILNQEPQALADARVDVPASVERCVRRCLEKAPEERFQTARDLGFALEAVAESPSATGRTTAQAATARPRQRLGRVLGLCLAAIALVGIGAGLATLRQPPASQPAVPSARSAVDPPRYHQVTFREGTIWNPLFAPDGRTIVYSAQWGREPCRIFATSSEGPAARTLGDGMLLAVSPTGELAILTGQHFMSPIWLSVPGNADKGLKTLAVMPLDGGAARPVADDVVDAAYAPDGRLALVRMVRGGQQLEYPVGTVVYRTAGWLSDPRFSHAGAEIGLLDHPSLGDTFGHAVVVDTSGKVRSRGRDVWSGWGLAWSPDGDEIWFGASEEGQPLQSAVMALGASGGSERTIFRAPGNVALEDVATDGRMLLEMFEFRTRMAGLFPRLPGERDLSFLDGTYAIDLAMDGQRVLFGEVNFGGGVAYGVYLRRTAEADAAPTRLSDGFPLGLSPDGQWILATTPGPANTELCLVPAGPGERRALERGPIERYRTPWPVSPAGWLGDGKRVFFAASEPGKPARTWVQDVTGGPPRPVTPEGMEPGVVSPDGALVAVREATEGIALLPANADAGEPKLLRGSRPGDVALRFSGDGRSLYVTTLGAALPAPLDRIDLKSGRRETVQTFGAAATRSSPAATVAVSGDGKSYAYSYSASTTRLYVVRGFSPSPGR